MTNDFDRFLSYICNYSLPFNAQCPLKGHTYVNKPVAESGHQALKGKWLFPVSIYLLNSVAIKTLEHIKFEHISILALVFLLLTLNM